MSVHQISKSLVSSLRANGLIDSDVADIVTDEAAKMETPEWLSKHWWLPVLIITAMPLIVKGFRWLYDRYMSDDEPLTPLEAAEELVESLKRQQRAADLGVSL